MIDDGSLVSLGEKTEIRIVELTADNTSKLVQAAIFLRVGRFFANISRFVNRESRFSVRTQTAVAGVRGTDFVVETDDSMQTDVGVFDGEVTVEGLDKYGKVMKGSEMLVPSGKQTQVKRFMHPTGVFGFKKRMLRHQQKIRLLRKKAHERRKEIRRLIMERRHWHGEMLKKWKKFRLKHPKFKKSPKRRPHKPPIRPIN